MTKKSYKSEMWMKRMFDCKCISHIAARSASFFFFFFLMLSKINLQSCYIWQQFRFDSMLFMYVRMIFWYFYRTLTFDQTHKRKWYNPASDHICSSYHIQLMLRSPKPSEYYKLRIFFWISNHLDIFYFQLSNFWVFWTFYEK